MKYTKNLPLKLAALDFDFAFDNRDDETDYEVWKKGALDVTVDHKLKRTLLCVNAEEVEVPGASLRQIKTLDKLLNHKQKTK